MAVSLKHAFTSNVADSGDPNLVQPSNWNAEHTLTAGANTLLGAISAGPVVEIPCTAAGRAILDDADAAAQRTTLGVGTGDSPTFTGLTLSGVGSFSAGTALLPSLTTTGDTNTGMLFPAADTIAFSEGGVEVARINSSAQFLVGGTTADAKLTVTGVGTTSTTPSTTTDIGATIGIRDTGGASGNGGMLMFGSFFGYFGAIKGFLQNGSGPLGAIDFYTRNGSADATLTRRMRIDFNGNIGIGTGSPDALLSVNGIASFGAGAATTPSVAAFGDLNTGMWFPAADTMAVSTGGTEALRVNSSQQLLVGGTSADAKLTVTGVGTTSTTPSTTTDIGATLGIRSSGAGVGNGGMLMFGSSAGYFGAIKGFLQNGSGPLGAIDFYTRNASADATLTQRMRINFDGKIGIGTGSPDALLSVNGIASFGAGAVTTPSIAAFGDLNTGMWFPAADTIAWSTGGSERMRIESNGSVSIGTSASTTPLQVDVSASIVAARLANSDITSGSFVNLAFRSAGDGTARDRANITGGHESASNSGYLSFSTRLSGSVAEKMRISSTGNVGIGTTAPDALLSVNGVASFGDGAVGTPSIANFGDLNTGFWFPAADTIAASTAGAERLRVDANGNVVINTAAIATTATDGFLYVPSCAGTPTGTPTTFTGRVPIVVDTTNNKLYFYSGGQWRDAGP